MHYFITAETAGVAVDDLRILFDFEATLSEVASDVKIEDVELIGIVVVIMDPEIAEPFPPGMAIRRSRKHWDIKPSIAFKTWDASDPKSRLNLFVRATIAQVAAHRSKRVAAQSEQLAGALERGLERLTRLPRPS